MAPLPCVLAFALLLVPQDVRFGGWRLLGPVAAPEGLAEKLPPERGIEALRLDADGPDLEKKHKAHGGGKIQWVDLGADPEAHVDLGARLGILNQAAAYFHRTIDCVEATRVPLLFGSDDGLRLWLNGRVVLHADEQRGHVRGEQRVFLELEAGRNHLVAKVHNGGPRGPDKRATEPYWQRVSARLPQR